MMFVGIIGLVVLLVLFLAISDTLWVRVSNYQFGSTKDGSITIVQLSDLHGRTKFLNGSISRRVNQLAPDYLIITGDLISRQRQLPHVLAEIQRIQCSNVIVVPGNYEREGLEGLAGVGKRLYSQEEYDLIMQALQNQNIQVLSNSGIAIDVKDKQGLVYGFDNSIYGNERLTIPIDELERYAYVILLAHSPSIIKLLQGEEVPYDLLLVGHTHGGQIRIMNRTIGAYKYFHVGLKRIDSRKRFFIHRGLGTVKIPFRIGAPPEIAVFQIGVSEFKHGQ